MVRSLSNYQYHVEAFSRYAKLWLYLENGTTILVIVLRIWDHDHH